jgi:hypothetical protein
VRCTVGVRRLDELLGSLVRTVASLLRASNAISPVTQFRMDQINELFDGASGVVEIDEAVRLGEGLLVTYQDRIEIVRLLEAALAVLRNQGAIWNTEIPLEGGECRFCNMDRLWERAIWSRAKSVLEGEELAVELHPFARYRTTLFREGGPDIDPDIVVFRRDRPLVVLDAKYSEASVPAADDVYQIVCYARRLNAHVGALAYLSPGDRWFKDLGQTEEGLTIVAAGVSTRDLAESMSRTIAQIMQARSLSPTAIHGGF